MTPRTRIFVAISGLLLLFALTGCRASFVELTQTAVKANPPTPVRTPDPAFAAERGQRIFISAQCASCHTVTGNPRSIGPDLKGIAAQVAAAHPDVDVAAFLRESIVDVMAFVPDGYSGDLMPRNYATLLTQDEIGDLVAYMLTLE